jgi:hypothetical protein
LICGTKTLGELKTVVPAQYITKTTIVTMNDPSIHSPGASSFAMALMFGSILFATASLAARTYLTGDMRALDTAWHKAHAETFSTKNYTSWMTLLYHSSVFGLILLFTYICEFHPPFAHGEKSYDRDEFLFLTALLFVASAYTITRNDRSPQAPPSPKKKAAAVQGGGVGEANKAAQALLMGGNNQVMPAQQQHDTPMKQRKANAQATAPRSGGMMSDDGTMDMAGGDGDNSMMEDINLDQSGQTPNNKASKKKRQPQEDDVFKILNSGGMKKRGGSLGNLDDILNEVLPASANNNGSNNGSNGNGHFNVMGQPQSAHAHHQQQNMMTTNPAAAAQPVIQYPLPIEPVKACNDVLNRDQTEEWKGWMQFMFLLYHYYHAEETYNAIRIMITCYVWMTGFGNFSFFYLKNDFSLVRVLQMIWRLNFLVVFLCLSQGTSYILYYICLLHTYFFFMVYVTMRVGSHLNYSRIGLRMKLLAVAVIIYLVWDVDTGLFQLLHFPFFGTTPQLGAGNGGMWEWYFRSTLDHWSTFLGMIFALNFPIVSLFFRKLESQHPIRHWGGKAATGAALLAAFYFWVTGPYMQNKRDYNATNSYFGFIPLITYIFFRNLTPTLRSYSLDLLHQIGKTTLETYLMQHHIWLTSDAKSLLVLVPGYPKVNMLVVTCIYYLVSRRLYKLTLFLRGMLLPNDKKQCLQSLTALTMIIGMFYALAFSLMTLHMVSMATFVVVSMVGGVLIYQTVMDSSWQQYRDSAPSDADPAMATEPQQQSRISAARPESPIARLSPPLIGTMVLVILSLAWQGITMNGAGKILSLPATCEADVNHGTWVPTNGCSAFDYGVGYRNHDVLGMASCTGTYVWGWYATPSNSMCRFTHRSKKMLQKQLQERHIVFIGDSMTRSVFHAFSRAMGDKEAGRFDATVPKHSDIVRTIGGTKLEFKWAPMAQDATEKLKVFTKAASTPQGRDLAPDTILLGGGAWDRLHVWATNDQDHKQLKSTLTSLASEMTKAKEESDIPTVWMNPTTINTRALLHQDKRDNLKEKDMVEMRALTADMGVWAASTFVLDGTAFTQERVHESFDGVHYPNEVYDAGAQILANSMDWVLPERYIATKFVAPTPGSMANPMLGLFMLCFVAVGLFFYDGLLGFSYLASLFASNVMPNEMFEEAFEPLHRQAKLPPIQRKSHPEHGNGGGSGSSSFSASDEIMNLLGGGGGSGASSDVELGSSNSRAK